MPLTNEQRQKLEESKTLLLDTISKTEAYITQQQEKSTKLAGKVKLNTREKEQLGFYKRVIEQKTMLLQSQKISLIQVHQSLVLDDEPKATKTSPQMPPKKKTLNVFKKAKTQALESEISELEKEIENEPSSLDDESALLVLEAELKGKNKKNTSFSSPISQPIDRLLDGVGKMPDKREAAENASEIHKAFNSGILRYRNQESSLRHGDTGKNRASQLKKAMEGKTDNDLLRTLEDFLFKPKKEAGNFSKKSLRPMLMETMNAKLDLGFRKGQLLQDPEASRQKFMTALQGKLDPNQAPSMKP